jgi:hypothetical protein
MAFLITLTLFAELERLLLLRVVAARDLSGVRPARPQSSHPEICLQTRVVSWVSDIGRET